MFVSWILKSLFLDFFFFNGFETSLPGHGVQQKAKIFCDEEQKKKRKKRKKERIVAKTKWVL